MMTQNLYIICMQTNRKLNRLALKASVLWNVLWETLF